MGRLRSVRRLLGRMQRDASGTIVIPQADGTIARFSERDLAEAYLRNCDIQRAKASGEDSPQVHPLQLAIQTAATHESWYEAFSDSLEDTDLVEDLSEPSDNTWR
jgi:hypothetical protein